MNSNPVVTAFVTMTATLVAMSVFPTRLAQSVSPSQTASPAAPQPLLLEKNEGERRIWRDLPPGDFILKVSPQNNNSRHLVLVTEDLAPGDEIPTHQHLGQDEILYITTGTVHVHLGGRERDLHAGGTVFIPAYTWVSVKNVGAGTVGLVAVFSAPGFENLMRCESRLPNEKQVPLSPDDYKRCERAGHVVYREPEAKQQP